MTFVEPTVRCRCGKVPHHPYNKTVIFRRNSPDGRPMFYPVTGTVCEDWAEHAALNPGTLAIDTIEGKRLWPEGSEQ